MARFDSVTELPNRRCFEEELALALRRDDAPGDGLTVMFLDLDDFKQVNDSLGHRTGDKLLVEIATRLRAIIGPQRSGRALGRRRIRHPSPSRARPTGDPRPRQAHHRRNQPRGGDRRERGDRRRKHRQRLGAGRRAQSRRPALESGYRALCGEGGRAAGVEGVRAGDGRQDPDSPADRARTARGGRHGRNRGLFPADHLRRDEADRRLRGAGALAQRPARPGVAGRIHPDRRGDRAHGGDGRGGAEAGLQGVRGMAGRGQRVGQSVVDAVPQRPSRKDDPRRPGGRQSCAGAARPGNHRIDPARGSGRHAPNAPGLARPWACAFRSTISAPDIRA